MSFAGLENYKPKLGSNEPEMRMLQDIMGTNIQIGLIWGASLAAAIFVAGVIFFI